MKTRYFRREIDADYHGYFVEVYPFNWKFVLAATVIAVATFAAVGLMVAKGVGL